ncbi:MAG: polynucleotide adenylyltransferase PcnB [Candidatus Lernaella stagnicola]|nr:polynucleotide adenylyltransferase PcnB [Candidatus Lernaella stagnicola]
MLKWLRRITGKENADQNDEPVTVSAAVHPNPCGAAVAKNVTIEPLIVPRPEHSLSRKKIAINALKVMGRLNRHGYEAYLVGGSIRDILIGRRPKDFDLVTDARPDEVRKLFRNSRLIGRRFRLVHIFFHGGEIIEVSTFRKGVPFDPDSDSPIKEENTFGSPAEDACRRDLTINGLYYDLKTFNIIDFVGGMSDIRDRIVRVIGDPALRFREDPIRMLRAIRHSAGTGFTIEPATRQAIQEHASEITKANPSRLRDEFMRELTEGRAARSINLMIELGLLQHIMPEARDALAQTERAAATRVHWLANLDALDEAISIRGQRVEITQPMIFAAFTAPLVKAQNFPAKVDDPRRLRGFLPGAIRDYLKPVLKSLGISRGYADAASMVLVGLLNLETSLARDGRVPRSLLRKVYFPPALILFQIEARGRKERLPQSVYDLAQEKDLLLFTSGKRGGRGSRKRPAREQNTEKKPARAQKEKPPESRTPGASLVFDPSAPTDAGPDKSK